MVTCKSCLAENSVDSLFCRKCGVAIAEEERTDAQQKLQDLISEGYRIFNEGRTEEAKLIAEAALADEPESTAALSLKGMCHERAGEIAEALAVYERVVERNPDSALDKIKVTHLRQSLSGKVLVEPAPSKGRALLAASAAVVLVIAVGIAIAAATPKKDNLAAKTPSMDGFSGTTDVFQAPNSAGVDPTKAKPVAPTGGAPEPGDVAPVTSPPASSTPPAAGTRTPPIRLPRLNGSILPNAGPGDESPVIPEMPNLRVEPQRPPPTTNVTDSGPDPVIERPGSPQGTDPKKPGFDPGFIEIKVSKPKTTLGGSQDVPDSNGVEALLKTARQQFLLGRHANAAASYEAALKAGADPASTNQRIGQSYANAGLNTQAANAYKRAINSYEAALNSPGSDKARLQSALEACRRALKTLGG